MVELKYIPDHRWIIFAVIAISWRQYPYIFNSDK